MEWLSWLFDQAKTASPLFAVASMGVTYVVWRSYQRALDDVKSMSRAQTKAIDAQTKSNLRVARTLGELAGSLKSRR